tara:strand:- start:118 stop:387 length:270 start_codon:yes stop_codon:yes gene_type:complete
MAHFAEINESNVVQRVIVVSNNDVLGSDGNESEAVGVRFCQDLLGGLWVQTSYNSSFRGTFAGIGYTYDKTNDLFVPPPLAPDDSNPTD